MRGERVTLSPPRRFMADLLAVSRHMPTVPVQRRMHLGDLVAAREQSAARVGWAAIFLKAYARAARQVPALRRAWVGLPTPHLRQYPTSVASVAVERLYQGEPCVFFGRVGGDPAGIPLVRLNAKLKMWASAPVGEVKAFRQQLMYGRLPGPIRRGLFRLGLNLPHTRAGRFGTFGLSSVGQFGADILHPLGPLTTTLTYGPVPADGAVDVRLVFDHRVLDGATAARALAAIEEQLTGPVADELWTAEGDYTQKDSNLQPSVP